MLQTASTTKVLPSFLPPCFEHMSFRMSPPIELISLSVSASMQCWAVGIGMLRPSIVIVISHRPALRAGRSSDVAGAALMTAMNTNDGIRCLRIKDLRIKDLRMTFSFRVGRRAGTEVAKQQADYFVLFCDVHGAGAPKSNA